MNPMEFFLVPEEIFRLGNTTSARLAHVRDKDIKTTQINGVIMVIADGRGISVFDKVGILASPMSGWAWRFRPNTTFPIGLKLVQDKAHHYHIAPTHNMPMSKYIGLLEELALKADRVFKKEGRIL